MSFDKLLKDFLSGNRYKYVINASIIGSNYWDIYRKGPARKCEVSL